MSLTPAFVINFDGTGLADGDDYVVDSSGVGHFHQVKAGATWKFRLQFPGVDTTLLTWSMQVRPSLSSSDVLLDTAAGDDTQITVTPDPDSNNTEVVRFSVSAAGTAGLQSGGSGIPFVYDIFTEGSGEKDVWVEGSGTVDPAVTRAA